MNEQDYKARLQILLNQNVITNDSYNVALMSFRKFSKVVKKNNISQAEMLFTHLPMALTRMASGEEVISPAKEIIEEVEKSAYYHVAKEQVAFIESQWKKPLPKGEKECLYIHFTNVLHINF